MNVKYVLKGDVRHRVDRDDIDEHQSREGRGGCTSSRPGTAMEKKITYVPGDNAGHNVGHQVDQ